MSLFDAGHERPASAPAPAPARFKLTVAYDGTGFHGFAAQRDVRTVEAVLGDALAKVLRSSVATLRLTKWRRYRYMIVNRPEPDPFLARYSWWVPEPLDLSLLRLAADPFVGEHDFAAFCRRGPAGSTTVRRVLDSRWLPCPDDGVLRYEIRAAAFCWQMVRSIVGTIVDAGGGRRRPGEILGTLRRGDRSAAGQLAPAQGLVLHDVGY